MTNNLNVCIVDDDAVYQFTMTSILEKLKSFDKILVFSDGEEAIEYLISNLDNNKQLPDVIFLDLDMPIMDGFQFMEEYINIKPRVGKKITIYMVSSSVDQRDIDKANSISEISDYIIKPIRPVKLKAIVEELRSTGKL
ncbi:MULTISPECIES: response regulator [Flavobacteriaceae]|uniref:response regulator n=1 Tax=Flavobacteriaceae TaxID=49546 RepID=UPI0010AEDB29|nr:MULTISPECIES: response regulator [Flavobacteriaceae]NJB37203.1 response regulator [Croceivirga sp. JEA036]TKD59311.1 response regulator [Flavobacterium sp. ASW18X]